MGVQVIDVAVVVPTIADREDLLSECVLSVRAALPDAEITVVKDVDRQGPAVARNRGAARAKPSEWLLFVDDDDLLLPAYADVVGPELADADVVFTGWCLTGAMDPVPPDRFDEAELRQHNTIPVTAMIRRSRFEAAGGFSTSAVREDHDLWLRLLDAGARFTYVPVAAWRYRRRPGSRTETEGLR